MNDNINSCLDHLHEANFKDAIIYNGSRNGVHFDAIIIPDIDKHSIEELKDITSIATSYLLTTSIILTTKISIVSLEIK